MANLNYLSYSHLLNVANLLGNTEQTVLSSAARTATIFSKDFINHNAKGLHLIADVAFVNVV